MIGQDSCGNIVNMHYLFKNRTFSRQYKHKVMISKEDSTRIVKIYSPGNRDSGIRAGLEWGFSGHIVNSH